MRGVTALQKPLPEPLRPAEPHSALCDLSPHPTAAAPAIRRQLACQSPVDPQLHPPPEAIHLTGEVRRQQW